MGVHHSCVGTSVVVVVTVVGALDIGRVGDNVVGVCASRTTRVCVGGLRKVWVCGEGEGDSGGHPGSERDVVLSIGVDDDTLVDRGASPQDYPRPSI